MGIITFWIICGIATAIINSEKGHGGCAGFILGVVLGPIGVIIALLSSSKDEKQKQKAAVTGKSEGYKKCPFCAEPIREEAIKCRYCGSDLTEIENK